jgi:NitT/TauT family transport system substrate-binding protein
MPAVDSIPLLIAQDQGYFADEGITVELQIFRNQLYRETALQTNAIDGSVSDLINAVYNWRSGSGIMVGSITDGHFSLVTAPDSPIRTIPDWNRSSSVDTGLLENSIIFYVAERMLERAGGSTDAITLVTTMQVPARMEMVVAGRIEAALLPEPVTRIAVAQGARVLADTSMPSTRRRVCSSSPSAPAHERAMRLPHSTAPTIEPSRRSTLIPMRFGRRSSGWASSPPRWSGRWSSRPISRRDRPPPGNSGMSPPGWSARG